ncbi:MAG: adenylosuccinate synthase [Planctomycetota bacterium]
MISRASAVVGLQWGDEGKGKIVDLLTPGFDAVVRYNGGANAGHTVVVDGEKYALHLVPSGILHGKLSVIAPGVVVDPDQLLRELEGLSARGVDTSGLVVSDRAHVVMPYHAEEDGFREAALGRGAIGTTRRGIGPAYAEKVQRATAIRVGDLTRPQTLAARVDAAVRAKRPSFERAGLTLDPEALLGRALSWGEALAGRVCDTTPLLHGMLKDQKRLLVEGANATLLDVDHGTFPFVTSSNSSVLGITAGSGLPPSAIGPALGVFKAYCTRVGAGPFPTEIVGTLAETIRERGNEYGTTTGRPRRVGWLDLVALRYSVMLNGVGELAMMLLDVLSGLDEILVCTSYRVHGDETTAFPSHADDLAAVECVYKAVPGFSEIEPGAVAPADLPAGARDYIDLVESFVGVPVSIVSVGPGRRETIRRGSGEIAQGFVVGAGG